MSIHCKRNFSFYFCEQIQRTIETYRIATPYALGVAFPLPGGKRLVTLEHLVRDCARVNLIVSPREVLSVPVVWTDDMLDLALLDPSDTELQIPEVAFAAAGITNGPVESLAPDRYGNPVRTHGTITGTTSRPNAVEYLVHTARLDESRSGAPLLDAHNELLGISTFLTQNGHPVGYALPAARLLPLVDCPLPNREHFQQLPAYEAEGISRTIENILRGAGYRPELSRRGPFAWSVNRGSAQIELIYSDRSDILSGDAYLCVLPAPERRAELAEFLLRENAKLEGLTFSIHNNHVLISMLIYNRYLRRDSGSRLFERLCLAADAYDDILVDRFGCTFA